MSRAGVDNSPYQDFLSSASVLISSAFTPLRRRDRDRVADGNAAVERSAPPRRTPRKSLIVVLPDNHVVSADAVTKRLLSDSDRGEVDVIVACAGHPRDLGALQRKVRDLQVLLAPTGTSTEDLRELAMKRAPGDIVTLVSAFPAERENSD
jgi:hypothetical protein